MDLEWLKLRPYNGDQKSAFEELVCQIADSECVNNREDFRRVGTPDGGVEAYCKLPDGKEYGWQAKFFQGIKSTQWTQITKSVKKAIETHPELVRYYICVPLDRPNARIKGQKSLMERWDDKVVEWETKARKSGREIEFIYWGSSELFSRLSRPEHIGRRSFWFNEIELDEDWFTQRLAEATNNLNKRYSPEVNFELPIATVFHGLGRDKTFTERWRSQFDELKVIANTAIRELNDQRISDESRKVSDVLQNLYHLANKNTPFRILIIDQYQIICTIKKAHETIDCLLDKLDELKRQDKQASGLTPYFLETDSTNWHKLTFFE